MGLRVQTDPEVLSGTAASERLGMKRDVVRIMVLGLRSAKLLHPRLVWFAVSLLGTTAVALSACGAARGPSAPTTGRSAAIPWISTPGQPVQGPVSQSAYQPCKAGDLALAAGPPGLLNGSVIENLALTNVSKTGCSLSGPPSVTWQLVSGSTTETAIGTFAGTSVDLAPGDSATYDVGPPNRCPSYNPADEKLASPITLTLPSGGLLAVSGAVPLDLQCGSPSVVEFAGDSPSAPPTSGEGALEITMTAPAGMTQGGTYRYTVTLTNPTSGTVSLVPCPSYTEGLTGAAGVANSKTYVLNCSGVGQLAPGASATFEMQYTIPSRIPRGAVKVWWWLQVPGGQLGGRVAEVS